MKPFSCRRQKLIQLFPQTAFVISAGAEASFARPHRSASDFYYLTGINFCPGSILIIAQGKTTLLMRPQSPQQKQWDGDHLPDAQQMEDMASESIEQLESIIRSICAERIAFAVGREAAVDSAILRWLKDRPKFQKSAAVGSAVDAALLIGQLRLIKDESEIAAMREAAIRSSRAHREIMEGAWIGKTESELARQMDSRFLMHGLEANAYPTLVGAGERGLILHAQPSERQIREGDLILVDAGAVWKGYCSDITRVIPAGRAFSPSQRQVYERVLSAQKTVIAEIRPGQTLQELDRIAKSLLPEMPHGVSHWLGLDVHDPSSVVDEHGEALRLMPGMCFTVEPGFYADGIGIRIEDDVVVTERGCEILSDAPKEIDEVESIRAQSLGSPKMP